MRPQTMVENLLLLAAVLMTPCNALRAAEPSVSDLIAQLGDEDYETREAAERQLTELGDATRGALRDLKTDDPEVAMRAARELYRTATCENVTNVNEALTLRCRLSEAMASEGMANDQKAQRELAERMEQVWTRIEKATPKDEQDLARAELRHSIGRKFLYTYYLNRQDKSAIAKAYAELEQAVDHYDAYLKVHPERKDVEERQVQVYMVLYGSRKQHVIACKWIEIRQR